MCSRKSDTAAFMETCWDDLHSWSAAMDAYTLQIGQARKESDGLALCVKDCFDCLELDGDGHKADTTVGFYHRAPNQNEEGDEIFYKQLGEASQSLALFSWGTWGTRGLLETQHRREQTVQDTSECVEQNFLTQLAREATRGYAPLDLMFVNTGLVGDEMVGLCLGQRYHEMIEFSVLGEVRRGLSRTAVCSGYQGKNLHHKGFQALEQTALKTMPRSILKICNYV